MAYAFSMYDTCITTLDRLMSNVEYMLKKGEANAEERGIEADIFLNARLAPDMYNLTKQVQTLTSLAKNCPHRIAGTEPPVFEDTEKTFAELYVLIGKTRKELASFSRSDIDGQEDREFSVKLGPMDVDFTGLKYYSSFTLPNVLFHSTTVYNILRHNGVPLGKFDFFGGSL